MSLKNKNGWIRIMETFIAIIIIAGVVLIVIGQNKNQKNDFSSKAYTDEIAILREIQLNSTIRNEIIGIPTLPLEWSGFELTAPNTRVMITEKTPSYLQCIGKICAINSDCRLEDQEKTIYSQSVIISADLTAYNPRVLKLFCWEKQGQGICNNDLYCDISQGETDLNCPSDCTSYISTDDLILAVQYYNDVLEEAPTLDDAISRKEVMLQLAQADPTAFLENTLPSDARSALPTDLQAQIEEPVLLEGDYTIVTTDDYNDLEPIEYPVINTGSDLFALNSPNELSMEIGSKISVSGFRLDSEVVAYNSNIQFLSAPNIIATQTSIRHLLVILVNYQDSPPIPFKKDDAVQFMNGPVKKYFFEQSYNKFTYETDVVGWIQFPTTSMRGSTCRWGVKVSNSYVGFGRTDSSDYNQLMNLVKGQVDLNKYDTILVIPNTLCIPDRGGWASFSKVHGKYLGISWARRYYPRIYTGVEDYEWNGQLRSISHELGHTLGVLHAGGNICSSRSFSVNNGDCNVERQTQEYGNTIDIMGTGFYGQFNTEKKLSLGWLDSSSGLLIKKSGLYSLEPFESNFGMRYGIVPMDPSLPETEIGLFPKGLYFLEYRAPIGYDLFGPTGGLAVISHWTAIITPGARDIYSRDDSLIKIVEWCLDGTTVCNTDPILYAGEPPLIDKDNNIVIGPVWSADDKSIKFEVRYPGSGPYIELNTSSSVVLYGGTATLSWAASPDSKCIASGDWSGAKSTTGSQVISDITSPATYFLTCTANGISTTRSVVVSLNYNSPIISFTASPQTIGVGGSSTLQWQAAPGALCYGSWVLNQEVPSSGSYIVTLVKTYSYALSCNWSGMYESKSVTITVDSALP